MLGDQFFERSGSVTRRMALLKWRSQVEMRQKTLLSAG